MNKLNLFTPNTVQQLMLATRKAAEDAQGIRERLAGETGIVEQRGPLSYTTQPNDGAAVTLLQRVDDALVRAGLTYDLFPNKATRQEILGDISLRNYDRDHTRGARLDVIINSGDSTNNVSRNLPHAFGVMILERGPSEPPLEDIPSLDTRMVKPVLSVVYFKGVFMEGTVVADAQRNEVYAKQGNHQFPLGVYPSLGSDGLFVNLDDRIHRADHGDLQRLAEMQGVIPRTFGASAYQIFSTIATWQGGGMDAAVDLTTRADSVLPMGMAAVMAGARLVRRISGTDIFDYSRKAGFRWHTSYKDLREGYVVGNPEAVERIQPLVRGPAQL